MSELLVAFQDTRRLAHESRRRPSHNSFIRSTCTTIKETNEIQSPSRPPRARPRYTSAQGTRRCLPSRRCDGVRRGRSHDNDSRALRGKSTLRRAASLRVTSSRDTTDSNRLLRPLSRTQPWHYGRSSKLNNSFNDLDDPSNGQYEDMALKIPTAPWGGAGESRRGGSVRRRVNSSRSKRTRTLHLCRFQSQRMRRVEGLTGCPPSAPRVRLLQSIEEDE